MKRAYWILTSAVFLSPSAHASDWQECASITGDSARLACYDKLAKVEPTHAVPTDHVQNPVAPDDTSSAPVPQAKALNKRIDQEKQANSNAFLMRAYKPNYFLPVTYTTNRLDNPVYDFKPQQIESKFQLSFQFNWWDHPFGTDSRFYFAYTQLSLWQTYNTESAPFRETNYEPEAGLDVTINQDLMGLNFRKVRASFIHQSNGQGGLRSRSWNRLALQTAFGRGNFAGALRGWYRIPESRATDDNPDITDYLGYGDLLLAYKFPTGTLSATLRNNLKSNNRGSIEIDYSFPLNKHIKGYVQYFNGYGESLIDYNRSINRIGIGIALTDWL
ncbi:phospholipase A [Halothiobacillus neapolitanus]|uniref:Phospholipase A1 n=1 Tax=Halothiobacillus neapolitanus (strain ATCC 23641 / DSM 15147 / CIP 104769 / NCIMB 8539 / c2) TaxID=555778 RepID=D0L0P7_HALNC|nr:phospholipase A [Halothiobacillus neapolitanus]ACX96270.1 Phospholipase A(2) [Halothiobacillus neapolitanus c2]TDN66579.1 phospholipase A1 [Halothiobacillus neapolitanus]